MNGWRWSDPVFAGDALPGIRVESEPVQAARTLPRMDVAVFAGFAARGPCHRAIAVSSVPAFETVFGGECTLAYDRERGSELTANLPASVRAFFSNGGQRCWVIRLAATAELLAAAAAAGVAVADLAPAQAGLFPLTGILRRTPSPEGDVSIVAPTMLAAASLGSWSDSLRLAARLSRQPLDLAAPAKVKWGFRFADRGVLAAGDLIELIGGDGMTTRYAKVARIAEGEVFALWIASFLRILKISPTKTGSVEIAGESGRFDARFDEGDPATVQVEDAPATLLRAGRWAHFFHQGEAIWMRIDEADGNSARGPAWQQVASRLPGPPFSAAKLAIDIREYQASGDRTHAGLSPSPDSAGAIQSILDADLHYADSANRTAAIRPAFAVTRAETERTLLGYSLVGDPLGFAGIAARFGTDAFTPADRIALRSAWLPIGLDATYSEPAGPLKASADSLARDGLAVADERLFLDPRLSEGSAASIAERAAAILHVDELPLFGIHAALDIAGDLFPEPSLLAVPDAAQTEWALGAAGDAIAPPEPGAAVQPGWLNHQEGCPAEAPGEALAGPDRSRFLDCSTRLLEPPVLDAPATASPEDGFTLSWNAQPEDSVAILEESGSPDFTAAVEILRGEDTLSIAITDRPEGIYYYRLRIELDGNVSAYASAAVAVRGTRFEAGSPDSARLLRLHLAILRLAGGSGDLFALLSLPGSFRTAEAALHARNLRSLAIGAGSAEQLGASEQRLLSYGALYHPWLAGGIGESLSATSPDGAVAGAMAKRARERGAWIAPANDQLLDIIGLEPSLPEKELLDLDRARVNMVRRLPAGFALHDADTLSDESDWRQINVRRLMMLLRRTALRRGMTYVFEGNGPVLRRAIERDLRGMLDDLQERGAFAGKVSAQSFRVAVDEKASDPDTGRLVVEIAVRPAQPMRFLTLRLVQVGARLTILEEA
jgi:hypothetical protein